MNKKMLIPAAALVAVLFDRLMFAPFLLSDYGTDYFYNFVAYSGTFWACLLVIYYILYFKRLRPNPAMWYIAVCSVALCAWQIIFFKGNEEFGLLTYFVIPCVLMAHTQIVSGEYGLKEAGSIASAWLQGWFVKPFTGIPALIKTLGSLFPEGNKNVIKKIVAGALIALVLLSLIVPLLLGADMVFSYFMDRVFSMFDLSSFVIHFIVTLIAFILFFSFLWNIGYGERTSITIPETWKIDSVIVYVALGAVLLVYILFCGIQFTYLFAGAGLPEGMTYSEYAREGFAQTVAVCILNFLLFGAFLRFKTRGKYVTAFLSALLILTSVILVSGYIRLSMYIGVYGLTWLRLLSFWFMIYLSAAAVLCAVRLFREKLPLVMVLACVLIGWYALFGYANPNSFMERYNVSYAYGEHNIPPNTALTLHNN